jgi:hypothetical protein
LSGGAEQEHARDPAADRSFGQSDVDRGQRHPDERKQQSIDNKSDGCRESRPSDDDPDGGRQQQCGKGARKQDYTSHDRRSSRATRAMS